jgi:diguanylate cyclase (GGDEF)-like protein/PAS domain S-box-containing protein
MSNEIATNQAIEQAVQQRTAALLAMNNNLQKKLAEHKAVEVTLRQSEERLQQIVQGTADGILILNGKGIVQFTNTAAASLLGHPTEDLIGLDIRLPLTTSDTHEIQVFRKTARGMVTRDIEIKLSRTLWENEFAYLASLRDVTERKRNQEELTYSASHDSLTGLPNRTALMTQIEAAIIKTQINPSYLFAVLFLDLDAFKSINDRLGHAAGDHLLIEVAHRLALCLRPSDQIARIGGDEFVIFLNNIHGIHDATHVVERIQTSLAAAIIWEDQQIFTTTSIGIAISKETYIHPNEILQDADSAMYRAKKQSHGCYEFFDTGISACTAPKFHMEQALKQALDRQEFILHYQPIIDLRSQEITGFEALLRWCHPERGIIMPDEFIPTAEQTGLIIPLGAWVLSTACAQLKIWQQELALVHPLSISINVSSLQLKHPGFLALVENNLQKNQIDPSCLNLEITESMIMEDSDTTIALLQALRDQNIQLSLDDFGTGYSSLAALHRFPINTLKIDCSFTQRLGSDPKSLEIIRAIMTLAQTMDLAVIAEGIETLAQQTHLRALNCHQGQGFLFTKAIDSQAASTLLQSQHRLAQWAECKTLIKV